MYSVFSSHHGLKTLQPETKCRASLLDDFIKSVGVTGSEAAAPTHSSKKNGTGNNRLVKDLQHAAHVERSQLPQEIESAHPLLVHSLGIRSKSRDVVWLHRMCYQRLGTGHSKRLPHCPIRAPIVSGDVYHMKPYRCSCFQDGEYYGEPQPVFTVWSHQSA